MEYCQRCVMPDTEIENPVWPKKSSIIVIPAARYKLCSQILSEDPTADGPYGGKGVGEISTMPVPPAIVNAVYNACGVRFHTIPIDQDWLAGEIKNKK